MRSNNKQETGRRLTTFAGLQSYLADFAAGRYPFLWIVGRPGAGKSEAVKAALKGRKVYFHNAGQLTPLRFYTNCYQYRRLPVILDDAEQLLENPLGVRLVSALGDTTPTKLLCYGTT